MKFLYHDLFYVGAWARANVASTVDPTSRSESANSPPARYACVHDSTIVTFHDYDYTSTMILSQAILGQFSARNAINQKRRDAHFPADSDAFPGGVFDYKKRGPTGKGVPGLYIRKSDACLFPVCLSWGTLRAVTWCMKEWILKWDNEERVPKTFLQVGNATVGYAEIARGWFGLREDGKDGEEAAVSNFDL